MSLILAMQCDCVDPTTGKDCQSKIHGEEAITLRFGRVGENLDAYDTVLEYGEGLAEDLGNAAIAAGWHHDGREWTCKSCLSKRWQQVLREEAIIRASGGRPATTAELIAQRMPTAQKLEAVAHSLNV